MNRTDIINAVCRACSAQAYLEVGVWNGRNFDAVECPTKVGVDPDPSSPATHRMTSDEFFDRNKQFFDVIFLDGLHTEHQFALDVASSLMFLREGGAIVCHDMNPTAREMQSEEYSGGAWTGQAWKHFARLRMTRPDLEMFVVDADYGCGVIRRGSQEPIPWVAGLDYSHLESDRRGILNLITTEEFLRRTENGWNTLS